MCVCVFAWSVPCIWLSFSRRATGIRQAPASRLHPSLLIWLGHWLAVSGIAFACCRVFKNSLDPSSPPLLISQLPQGVAGITSRHDNGIQIEEPLRRSLTLHFLFSLQVFFILFSFSFFPGFYCSDYFCRRFNEAYLWLPHGTRREPNKHDFVRKGELRSTPVRAIWSFVALMSQRSFLMARAACLEIQLCCEDMSFRGLRFL